MAVLCFQAWASRPMYRRSSMSVSQEDSRRGIHQRNISPPSVPLLVRLTSHPLDGRKIFWISTTRLSSTPTVRRNNTPVRSTTYRYPSSLTWHGVRSTMASTSSYRQVPRLASCSAKRQARIMTLRIWMPLQVVRTITSPRSQWT